MAAARASYFCGQIAPGVSFIDYRILPTDRPEPSPYIRFVDIRNEIRRTLLMEHLELAAQHIADGETHIHRQQVIIADLRRAGHDTTPAEAFLREMRAAQDVHVASRDRIERELRAFRNLPL